MPTFPENYSFTTAGLSHLRGIVLDPVEDLGAYLRVTLHALKWIVLPILVILLGIRCHGSLS